MVLRSYTKSNTVPVAIPFKTEWSPLFSTAQSIVSLCSAILLVMAPSFLWKEIETNGIYHASNTSPMDSSLQMMCGEWYSDYLLHSYASQGVFSYSNVRISHTHDNDHYNKRISVLARHYSEWFDSTALPDTENSHFPLSPRPSINTTISILVQFCISLRR